MTDRTKKMAELLDLRQYREEVSPAEDSSARSQGLLIVYGASDDLCEFAGIYSEEHGAGEKTVFEFDGDGAFIEKFPDMHEELVKGGWKPPKTAFTVTAEFCPDDFDGTWKMSSSVPTEYKSYFYVYEDEDLYCRGLVIDVASFLGTRS